MTIRWETTEEGGTKRERVSGCAEIRRNILCYYKA